MSKVMTWRYAGTADITLGKEVHINPLPKIALATIISLIVIACTSGFVFRDYLYDMFVNPQLVLKYVNKTDDGFSVDIPYQFDFSAEKFIDEINTKEYEAFMNPDNSVYTYSIEGEVNTEVIGSYLVTYYSSNSANKKQIALTVNVIDSVAPVARLKDPITQEELKKSIDGQYKPMYIVRNHTTTPEYYGTLSWNVEDFILDYSDNYSDVTITYPDKPDWVGNSIEYRECIYTFADESGNKTELILPLYVVTLTDTQIAELADGNIKLNEVDLAEDSDNTTDAARKFDDKIQQIAQTEHDNNNKPGGGGNGSANDPGVTNDQIDYNDHSRDDEWRAEDWQNTPTNEDGTHTGRNPQIVADAFTWSVSTDGPFGQAFVIRAANNVHYYNYDGVKAQMTSGPFISFQPDGPGTYSIHWEAENGLSCDQTVYLTE